ncbi:MAG: AAA family ATPase [Ferruginibacter sp.]
MYIDRIILNNFRVYKGENVINLSVTDDKNVAIITGNNGFGKTSLLTSLVWCLYGKLMADVEERYRKEIYDGGGYKNYCRELMNRSVMDDTGTLNQNLFSFSVSIRIKKLFIPVIPCNDLEITRSYNVTTNTETLTVKIDGQPNELTKEVGPEIFINDFILRKEIAKFFFFDAEKIVGLAEVRSIEDRRSLGNAYSEVLGIKKYLDLKGDLENLRLRISKKSAKGIDRERLDKLTKQFVQNGKIIEHQTTFLTEKEEELLLKRIASDKFQERLIREGSSITLEEMKDFKIVRDQLQQDHLKLKNRMKEMMELAPLAIAASQIEKIKVQLYGEQDQKDIQNNDALLRRKTAVLKDAIKKSGLINNDKNMNSLYHLIEKTLLPHGLITFKPLLDFSAEQENRFDTVHENLRSSFSKSFKSLAAELKMQQTSLAMINRKLSDAESKENDPVIKAIRNDKNQLDTEIHKIENEVIDLKAKNIAVSTEQNSLAMQISELNKKVAIENKDKAKDEIAARLISELEAFIYKLKDRKKHSLEEKILAELQVLMHKSNFIEKVEVSIQGDLIDIELYDHYKRKINKDSLSKGEQQLYATALLKALVDESNIKFPVFIDSPLQKFDKEHARNIIQDFYPNVSSQVILFPLLHKELNEEEFGLLQSRVASCYFIEQLGQYESTFKEVEPVKLYSSSQTLA